MRSRDGTLNTEQRGDGPALVLVHGYLGSARHWDLQLPAFARGYRCVAPDLAGFGGSAGMPVQDTISGHAALVLSTLTALGIERFHLLGHSMGGMIVQEMASLSPERIERLILYGTGPFGVLPDRFEPISQSRRRLETEGLEATARRIAATWFEKGAKADCFESCVAEAMRADPAAALASLAAWETWNGLPALAGFRMPTLVLWGDGDRSYGWKQPETLWRTIPDCRLAVVPGCRHAVHMEKPALFNAIVLDFLDSAPTDHAAARGPADTRRQT